MVQDDDKFFEYQANRGFPMSGFLHNQILDLIPDGGNAIDIGAHVGIWSRQLVKKFDEVWSWEPIESNCECLRVNVPEAKIIPFAAASVQKKKGFMEPDKEGNYGGYQLGHKGEEVIVKVVDDFDFKRVKFIQMHIKGYEYDAMLGCRKTLQIHKPMVVYQAYDHQMEMYGHSVEELDKLLTDLGYHIVEDHKFRQWDITYKVAQIL